MIFSIPLALKANIIDLFFKFQFFKNQATLTTTKQIKEKVIVIINKLFSVLRYFFLGYAFSRSEINLISFCFIIKALRPNENKEITNPLLGCKSDFSGSTRINHHFLFIVFLIFLS